MSRERLKKYIKRVQNPQWVPPQGLLEIEEEGYDPDIQVFRDQYESLKREEYEE